MLHAHLHENREEVSLALFIVVLYILAQYGIHLAATHIWRVHNQCMIILCKGKNHLDAWQQQLDVLRTIIRAILCPFCILVAEHGQILLVVVKAHDAAQVFCFFEKFKILSQHFASHIFITTHKLQASLRQSLFIHLRTYMSHIHHMRKNMCISKCSILLTSLQQKGKSCQLLGTGVEVDTREVVAEDFLHSLSTTIAFGNIKVIKQVETFVENMTGTAGKVGYL